MKQKIQFEANFAADGLAVKNKNLGFLRDPEFRDAWLRVKQFHLPHAPKAMPDIRWRAHLVVWAARHALRVPGDFVECGVCTGVMMSMVCALTTFPESGKRALLFDTFSGIPVENLPEQERARASAWNRNGYQFDTYAVAQEAFAPYANVRLVRGVLPESLNTVALDGIAFLHVDLNVASAEIACAEALWPKLSPGAVVVLDDYGFHGHQAQYEAWNAFAAARGLFIATLPTGQGLILIPPR